MALWKTRSNRKSAQRSTFILIQLQWQWNVQPGCVLQYELFWIAVPLCGLAHEVGASPLLKSQSILHDEEINCKAHEDLHSDMDNCGAVSEVLIGQYERNKYSIETL